MKLRRTRTHRLLGLFLFALGAVACGGASVPPSEHAFLNKTVEPKKEPSLDGRLVSFPTKGKVTVIDFWSTSCVPCKKLMPEIEALHAEKKDLGVEVIGIAVDDNPGLVQKVLAERGVTYETVMDPASNLQGAYKVTELPQTFVFDRAGTLRFFTKGGELTEVAQIRQAVDALISEQP